MISWISRATDVQNNNEDDNDDAPRDVNSLLFQII